MSKLQFKKYNPGDLPLALNKISGGCQKAGKTLDTEALGRQ